MRGGKPAPVSHWAVQSLSSESSAFRLSALLKALGIQQTHNKAAEMPLDLSVTELQREKCLGGEPK